VLASQNREEADLLPRASRRPAQALPCRKMLWYLRLEQAQQTTGRQIGRNARTPSKVRNDVVFLAPASPTHDAMIRTHEASNNPQQCRLSGPVGSNDCKGLTFVNRHRYVGKYSIPTERLADPPQFHHGGTAHRLNSSG
jgi:hypothetical protein